jgi:MYXO-CTERM domain-containing protein
VGPPAGPFVVLADGYQDFNTGEAPPLEDSEIVVEVVDSEGVIVEGTLELQAAEAERLARIIWTPAEPLGAGPYTLRVNAPDSPLGQELEIPLSPTEEVEAPVVELTTVSAKELQRGGGSTECCQAADAGDAACVMDSCGGYQWGEECRICWNTKYVYPINLQMESSVSGGGTNYLDLRLFHTAEDGSERELLSTSGPELGRLRPPNLPEDTAFPICLQLEAEDVVNGTIETSEVVCVTEADLETVEHTTIDNSEAIDRCEAGTYVERDDDGGETPIEEPEGGSGKESPGGCSAAKGSPSWFGLMVLGLLFGVRRRR